MSACRVTRCCCFDNTKDGSFACGIYTAAISLLTTMAVSVLLSHSKGDRSYGVLSPPYMIALVVLYTFFFLSSVLLLYSLKHNKRLYLIPWLLRMIGEFGLNIAALGLSIKGIIDTGPIMFIVILITLFFFCLNAYCFVCVRSHFAILGERILVINDISPKSKI